jgi:hypothetical protein
MAKIRVYELATKLGLDNKEIVDKLNQAGIEVKNHMRVHWKKRWHSSSSRLNRSRLTQHR